MKRQLLLSLTLSLLASTAFALPANEQAVSAEAKASSVLIHDTLADGGSSHPAQQYQRVAQDGSDYAKAQHSRG
jgi:hypothetical protein